MSRLFLALFASLFASSATPAPADWKSYLCRYEVSGVEYAQVVKVNEKQQRVVLDDRDATKVKFSANSINFGGPRGDWLIQSNGDVHTMRGMSMGTGKCTKIED